MSMGLTTAQLNFEIIDEIGHEGSNSKVYTAHDIQLDTILVIKKIEKSKFTDPNLYYSESKKLFDSEHQHVVQVKYSCDDPDYIYIAMPYYKNGSLKKLIDSRFLTVREIIRYGIQFLSGLHNIHVKKLIHFDIKPDNILISDKDEALISDFGLAKNMNALGFSPAGQLYFKQIPPEAFAHSVHSMLYDIYNSGLTLYRMCNGNKMYYNQLSKFPDQNSYTDAIIKGQFPDRKRYLPHIPKSLVRTINRALAVDMSKRYQTVLDLINDLASINELLDWEYQHNNSEHIWKLDLNDKCYKTILNVVTNNNGTIETFKTMKSSGGTTRVSAGCKHIPISTVTKEVQNILLSLK